MIFHTAGSNATDIVNEIDALLAEASENLPDDAGYQSALTLSCPLRWAEVGHSPVKTKNFEENSKQFLTFAT